MKIESKIGKAAYSEEKIFNYISDFRNFSNLIPQDKVNDWQADKERCSFSVNMIGKVGLFILEKQPYKLVKITGDPAVKQQHDLTLWIQIKEVAENDSRLKITVEPKVNKIMMGMIKPQLKKFVDTLIDQIETFSFDS